jgi:hypothetical protein
MTVQACRRDIKQCSADDQEVHQALNQSLARSGEKKARNEAGPNGPGFEETKKRQGMGVEHLVRKVGVGKLAQKVVEKGFVHGAKDIAQHAGKKALANAISIVGWVKTGVEVTTYVHKASVETAKELGQELHEGNLRDAQSLAILRMASPKLPKEYVSRETATRSRAGDYARKIETGLQARPPAEYLKLVKSVQQSAQAGIEQAKKLGVDSEAKLAEALARNADFAKAYDANTAFRHGVRSQLR